MSDASEKIETLQAWINELQQNVVSDSIDQAAKTEVLSQMLTLIQAGNARSMSEQTLSETYVELEKQVHEQTAALSEATIALKRQIMERESSVIKLRNAYTDLETNLQEHITDHSRLNQRLQQQIGEYKEMQALEREERALTEALRDTLATMSSTLDLDKIFDHILDTIGRVTPYDGANILLVESDLVHVVRQKGYFDKGLGKNWLNKRIPLTKLAILQQLIDFGKPLAIADTSTSPMWIGFPDLDWVHSNVIAPIRSNNVILGFLSLDSATPGHFTQVHADRLQTFADQTAIAIQNARLLDRAKRAAVMAERNRLANELHDTISQTLWSMSLITERLPVVWEIDKAEGLNSLRVVHQLSQNALEEMRALLLELRPASLTDENLGDLIRQVAAITANRAGLNISVQIEEQDAVPPDVHFALYRVVQESLNNVVLHASASNVEIYFSSHLGRIDLAIHDNGVGFNPKNMDVGRLGLSIMKDRIRNIGGTLEIISDKGEGTLLKVVWMVDGQANIV